MPGPAVAGCVGQADESAGRLHEIELGAVRVEQVARCVDDLHEEVGRVADRRDPRGDLAQCLLRAGPPPDLLARLGDRLDQAGVLDRDRRLASQRLGEPDLLRPERADFRPPDLEDPQHALVAGERRDDQRADAVAPDRLVEVRVVLEPVVVEVVGADDGLARS